MYITAYSVLDFNILLSSLLPRYLVLQSFCLLNFPKRIYCFIHSSRATRYRVSYHEVSARARVQVCVIYLLQYQLNRSSTLLFLCSSKQSYMKVTMPNDKTRTYFL